VTAIADSPTQPPAAARGPVPDLTGASGLERLQAYRDGRVPPPPAWVSLGFRLDEAAPGRVVFAFQPLPGHANYGGGADRDAPAPGTVHGGVLSSLCDSAIGCAIFSVLEGGWWCATIELKVNFLRPVRVAGPVVRAVGTLRWRGSSTALGEATLEIDGEEVVTSSSTYALRRNP
jgi:uncharacterized protein (TIGR00369 family)